MSKQAAALWRDEYDTSGIPSSFRDNPSGSVFDFVDFLERRGITHGRALDIGCGRGRNSIYLADHGYRVDSVDFVPDLVSQVRAKVADLGLKSQVNVYCADVADVWPFEDRTFDVAVDTFCYKHQITTTATTTYRSEVARVVKPGGFYLLTLAGIDDGYYGPLLETSPEPDRQVIVDPNNGIASILYDKSTIVGQFGFAFDLVDYEHKLKEGDMHSATYMRSTHVFVMRRQRQSD